MVFAVLAVCISFRVHTALPYNALSGFITHSASHRCCCSRAWISRVLCCHLLSLSCLPTLTLLWFSTLNNIASRSLLTITIALVHSFGLLVSLHCSNMLWTTPPTTNHNAKQHTNSLMYGLVPHHERHARAPALTWTTIIALTYNSGFVNNAPPRTTPACRRRRHMVLCNMWFRFISYMPPYI